MKTSILSLGTMCQSVISWSLFLILGWNAFLKNLNWPCNADAYRYNWNEKAEKDQKNRIIIAGKLTEICSWIKLLFAFCPIKFHSRIEKWTRERTQQEVGTYSPGATRELLQDLSEEEWVRKESWSTPMMKKNFQGRSRYRARVRLVTRRQVGQIRPGTRGGFLSLE